MVAQQLVGWGALIIKMRKLMLLILMGMFLVSLASAESIGTFTQDDCVDLIQTAVNASYVKISSITYPDSTQDLAAEITMQKTGTYYNYTFCNTTNLGTYQVSGYGDELGIDQVWAYTFDVTYSGKEISTSQGIMYIVLFAVLFFVFIGILFVIDKLPRYNQQDEEGRILSISYLKYFRPVLWFTEWMLFIGSLYISSNLAFAFLNEQLFAKVLFTLFKICFGISPIIIILWMIWIFVSMFHDRQFQKLLNRGIFPEGRLP